MAGNNINNIYNTILFICRKERGAFISVSNCMNVLDMGQMELLAEAFSQYQINQTVSDALSPFKVRLQFATSSFGEVSVPSDYQHLLGGIFTVTGSTVNPVRFLTEDTLSDALTSQLRPVTTSNPRAMDSSLGFQLYPQIQQTGFYTYLRRPLIPVLSYTQVGRTLTYNPLTSIQIEFYDVYINNIIARALKYLGINMDEQQIEQFAQIQSQETNTK